MFVKNFLSLARCPVFQRNGRWTQKIKVKNSLRFDVYLYLKIRSALLHIPDWGCCSVLKIVLLRVWTFLYEWLIFFFLVWSLPTRLRTPTWRTRNSNFGLPVSWWCHHYFSLRRTYFLCVSLKLGSNRLVRTRSALRFSSDCSRRFCVECGVQFWVVTWTQFFFNFTLIHPRWCHN